MHGVYHLASKFFVVDLLLVIFINFACGAVYHITPSQDATSCPLHSCMDLSELAATIDFSSENETNITLLFLPGNHSLDRKLVLINSKNIYITKPSVSGTVYIECASKVGRVIINNVTEALIEGLLFVGCGGNLFSMIDDFKIMSCVFKGIAGSSTAVILNETTAIINTCIFINNTDGTDYAYHKVGGAIIVSNSNVWINSTQFEGNSAELGGALFIERSSHVSIHFHSTRPTCYYHKDGGMIHALETTLNITSCLFIANTAQSKGGVLYTVEDDFTIIINSMFINNTVTSYSGRGGVIYSAVNGSFYIVDSTFTGNTASIGGVISDCGGSFYIDTSSFTHNKALGFKSVGGVIDAYGDGLIQINACAFSYNKAKTGGVLYAFRSSFYITNSTFSENIAAKQGIVYSVGRLYPKVNVPTYSTNNLCHIDNSNFSSNTALGGGIISLYYASVKISGNTNFVDNNGSLYIFNSNLTIIGFTNFANCADPELYHRFKWFDSQGGAITSILSNVQFKGKTQLLNNKAVSGGAILAFESTVSISSPIIIADNQALNNGGGISLHYSKLEIAGVRLDCTVSCNNATRGGAIHGIGSMIIVNQPSIVHIINNSAVNGSGLYFEGNTKFEIMNLFKNRASKLNFIGNRAEIGGAIFVDDKSSSTAVCTTNSECFFQYWSFMEVSSFIHFSNNSATKKGSNIYGGMLNRCRRNPFTGLRYFYSDPYTGILYMKSISNIHNLKSISSLPVQVCLCDDQGSPDCNSYYQLPTVNVKKGETFNVSLVAVDQVNNPLAADINSYLLSHHGAFDESQQTQSVNDSCTNLTFNIFSSNSFEILVLYADGPCADSEPSVRYLNITFSNCTCPIGFEPSSARKTRCECVCDSRLFPYITLCNYSTSSVTRVGTSSWITYINDTDNPGFVIHPNCPFHYCHDSDKKVSINFNILEGADAQCAHFRRGILCGSCQQNLSLSLGSSHCLPCHSHWPVVTITILFAFFIAGFLLVGVLLVLNMTVAVGLINGFIFYSNIIAAASSYALFRSSKPSFPSVFVAWLNLDIGFDVCFIDGLDAYTKTWLQLAFPIYVISLVFLIILCSSYFPKFAMFIGKRDPVSTLATLILLSYAKLLSVIISVLSFAILDYPDGTQSVLWLLDGNIKYCRGKHLLLFVAALIIILIGVPYTSLLLLWQWLVRLPKWRIFRWIRNTKLNAFISTYHVPYNGNCRYWTGLLLLMRIVLYITGAATASKSPQVVLLVTIISIGSLLLHKGITRVYRKLSTDIVETVIYFNILVLASFTIFEFKTDSRKQVAVTYMSTILTFILLVGVVVYQISLLVRKKEVSEDIDDAQSSAIIELSGRQQVGTSLSNNRSLEVPYRLMPYESNSN